MAKKSRQKVPKPAVPINRVPPGVGWLPIYSDTDLDAIAQAVGVTAEKVEAKRQALENAAGWFRTDSRAPRRTPPSTVRRKIADLRKALDRAAVLLGDPDVRDAVGYESERQNGNLDAAANAAADLAAWAKTATPATEYEDENGKAKSIVPRGHVGDAAINDWLAALLSIYKHVAERAAKVSVGSMRKAGGRDYGPLVRFIQACAAPLSIEMTDQAILERVWSLRAGKGKSLQKNI